MIKQGNVDGLLLSISRSRKIIKICTGGLLGPCIDSSLILELLALGGGVAGRKLVSWRTVPLTIGDGDRSGGDSDTGEKEKKMLRMGETNGTTNKLL